LKEEEEEDDDEDEEEEEEEEEEDEEEGRGERELNLRPAAALLVPLPTSPPANTTLMSLTLVRRGLLREQSSMPRAAADRRAMYSASVPDGVRTT